MISNASRILDATIIVINNIYGEISSLTQQGMYIISPSGQGFGSPFLASYQCISGTLRVQFGNNSGTDMLEQYGDFGTK